MGNTKPNAKFDFEQEYDCLTFSTSSVSLLKTLPALLMNSAFQRLSWFGCISYSAAISFSVLSSLKTSITIFAFSSGVKFLLFSIVLF